MKNADRTDALIEFVGWRRLCLAGVQTMRMRRYEDSRTELKAYEWRVDKVVVSTDRTTLKQPPRNVAC